MEQILTFQICLTSLLLVLQLFEFWVSYFQRRGFFFFNFPLKNFCNDRFTSQYLIQELHRIRFQNFHISNKSTNYNASKVSNIIL